MDGYGMGGCGMDGEEKMGWNDYALATMALITALSVTLPAMLSH